MFLSQFSAADVLGFILALVRILSMILTLPKLASDRYLLIFRILFGLVLALVVAPLVASGKPLVVERSSVEYAMLIIGETGIGLCLGLAASCVILGLLAAGQIVSQLLGFQIGSLQQGLGADQNADYRKLFFVIGLFSWFSISGHRFAVEGLMASFVQFPVGELHFSAHQMELINQLIGVSLRFAVQFSLPVLVVSVFGFLIAGFFSRILGSGQSTSIAFGLNQVLFFIIAVPLVVVFSEQTCQQTGDQIENIIGALTQFHGN